MSKFNQLYRDTLGDIELRGSAIGALYNDLEQAIAKGKTKWMKAIGMQLHSLGEGDYSEADHGEEPKNAY